MIMITRIIRGEMIIIIKRKTSILVIETIISKEIKV